MQAITEDWNGASWSEVADLNQARAMQAQNAKSGTVSNGLVFGGNNPPPHTAATEEWSGSSIATKVLTD